jgi:glycosyltransferase involved in cell wall biosynthesis
MQAERPLTVLLIHNRYREPGGEDAVFEAEGRLLEADGHLVLRHEVHNDRVSELGALRTGLRAVWSRETHRALTELAARVRPDVAHLHNTFPLVSPAAHHALVDAGVTVVQTLHNYRLICPQGLLLRDGRPCQDCVGKTPPWPGVAHACYRDSRSATTAVATMLTVHRALRTWDRKVAAFIALSKFARDRFVAGGLPAARLHVKPNFVHPDPGVGTHQGDHLLYVGRLSQEKGVECLLEAWRLFTATSETQTNETHSNEARGTLTVVGDGPLAPLVKAAATSLPRLRWEGRQPRERVLELMRGARALVLPSICYENFPAVIAEAYACGLPVLGSDLGSIAELVRDGETGRLFEPGSAAALARAMRWAAAPETDLRTIGGAARREFEARYTAAANLERLLDIYGRARATPLSGSNGGVHVGQRGQEAL